MSSIFEEKTNEMLEEENEMESSASESENEIDSDIIEDNDVDEGEMSDNADFDEEEDFDEEDDFVEDDEESDDFDEEDEEDAPSRSASRESKKAKIPKKVLTGYSHVMRDNINTAREILSDEEKMAIAFNKLSRAAYFGTILEYNIVGVERCAGKDGKNSFRVLFNNNGVNIYVYREDFGIALGPFSRNKKSEGHDEIVNREFALARMMIGASICMRITVAKRYRDDDRSIGYLVIGSRVAAMEEKRERYFFSGRFKVNPNVTKVKARVLAANRRVLRVESLGLETDIPASELSSSRWVNPEESYRAGDVIEAYVKSAAINEENRTVKLELTRRPYDANATARAINRITPGSCYGGTVVGINDESYFIALNGIGVKAVVPRGTYVGTIKPYFGDVVNFTVAAIIHDKQMVTGRCELVNRKVIF